MDRQLPLHLRSREELAEGLAHYVRPLELPRRQVLVLELIAARGQRLEIAGASATRLSISSANAARAAACAQGTFGRAVGELRRLGVLEVLKSTRPWTYIVNWSRVERLEPPPPPEPLEGLELFDPKWTPEPAKPPVADHRAITPDHPRSPRPRTKNKNNINPKNQTKPNQTILGAGAEGRLRLGPIDNDQLRDAFRGGSAQVLSDVWRASIECHVLEDNREDKTKFLALAHHASTTPTIHNPAGVLRRGLDAYDFSKVRGESWDWAAEFLRRRDSDRPRRTLAAAARGVAPP